MNMVCNSRLIKTVPCTYHKKKWRGSWELGRQQITSMKVNYLVQMLLELQSLVRLISLGLNMGVEYDEIWL